MRFLVTGWNRRITAFSEKVSECECLLDEDLTLASWSVVDTQALSLTAEPGWENGTPHNDDIITMDYCPPHYLATGSFDGDVVIWNTETERIVSRFQSMMKLKPQ